MGRGPKATISFTYCMARLESNAGGAAESGVFAGDALAEATLAVSPVAAAAFFCLEHAGAARIRIKHAIAKRPAACVVPTGLDLSPHRTQGLHPGLTSSTPPELASWRLLPACFAEELVA